MKLSRRAKKILKWVGYPAFFLLCFMISLVLTFPFERVKDKLQSHFREQYGVALTMDSISGSLPFGMTARNVVLMSEKADAFGGLLPLVIPRLDVDVGFFSMLAGTPSFSLYSAVFGGELRGSFSINEAAQTYKINMRGKDLQLEQMSAIKNRFKELPVKGVMTIKTDMLMDLATIKNSSGFLELGITKGVMGPGKWTFELPLIRTGTFDSRLVLSDGKLEVERFEQSSPDMMSDMVGSITLSQNLQYSRVNLDYRFKIADHLLEKYDIFQLALSTIRNAEAPDGYFYHTFRGALVSMKPVANKAAQYKFRDKDRKAPAAEAKPERGARPERPERPEVERPAPGRKPAAVQQPEAIRPQDRGDSAIRSRASDSRRTPPARQPRTPPSFGSDKKDREDGLMPSGTDDDLRQMDVPMPTAPARRDGRDSYDGGGTVYEEENGAAEDAIPYDSQDYDPTPRMVEPEPEDDYQEDTPAEDDSDDLEEE